jgi:hypothetical protein
MIVASAAQRKLLLENKKGRGLSACSPFFLLNQVTDPVRQEPPRRRLGASVRLALTSPSVSRVLLSSLLLLSWPSSSPRNDLPSRALANLYVNFLAKSTTIAAFFAD